MRTRLPVMLNWVAFSSCNRWSSSLRPPPSSEEEEKAGGGSVVRGDRGLHTVLRGPQGRQTTLIRQRLNDKFKQKICLETLLNMTHSELEAETFRCEYYKYGQFSILQARRLLFYC